MKKVLLFLFVTLSLAGLNAQSTFNRVYHNQKEETGPLLTTIHGDYYYSSNTYNFSDFGNCYIYKYGNTGNLKVRMPFQVNFINFAILNATIKTNDNKLLLIGQIYGQCDLPDSSLIRTFISKLDTNGNVLFITKIKRPFPNPFSLYTGDNFKSVLQNTDSTYCTFTDSVMYKFSKTGQLLFRKNLALDSISSCLLLQNNSILLSARQNSLSALVTISQNGTILTSQPFSPLLKKTSFYSGQKIMGLGYNGKLHKISPNLSFIGNSSSLLPGVKDFICDSDTIYSISVNNYCRADTSFNLFSVSTNTTQKLSHVALIKNNNVIGITSQCSTGGTGNYSSFSSLNVITKAGNNNFVNDIEVSSVTADSIYWATSGFHAYLRAKVKVKNKGTSVINEFTLNSDRNITAICGGLYYQQKFTQTIPPGDSAIVTTTFIHKQFFTMTPNSPTVSVQYCVFSTMPNGENDKFIANDELCKNFIFQNPTASIHELNNKENKLNIYPNPFTDQLAIESTFIIKKIEVYNALGALLYIDTPDKNTLIFNDKLNNRGVYFIKIETEKGTQIKKVVKQ